MQKRKHINCILRSVVNIFNTVRKNCLIESTTDCIGAKRDVRTCVSLNIVLKRMRIHYKILIRRKRNVCGISSMYPKLGQHI